jgi:hypothetical protein
MKNELAYWMMSHAGSAGHWNKETRNEVKDYTDRERERERERERVRHSEDFSVCLSFFCKSFFLTFLRFFPFVCVRGLLFDILDKTFFLLSSFTSTFAFLPCSFFALLFVSFFALLLCWDGWFFSTFSHLLSFLAFPGVFLLISANFLRPSLRFSF